MPNNKCTSKMFYRGSGAWYYFPRSDFLICCLITRGGLVFFPRKVVSGAGRGTTVESTPRGVVMR